ncbi:MAG: BtrH N-terminal domain-containing protein [Chloroflexota bacterium]
MFAPFKTFTSLETHHCVTGSMRHIYTFYDHPMSEEMLFGLGEGTGYIYWHQKGQPPFIGGRATPEPSLEEVTGQRTGVKITAYATSSARKAKAALLDFLEAGTPVMLQVDMGFLPYFDFGEEYHFGGHLIVACGYDKDNGTVLIADRDIELHPVSLEALARARGSTYKPFPPKNRWYTFDFADKRQPTSQEIFTAIRNQAVGMLHPPISNMGVKGIRKTAKRLPEWRNSLDESELRFALFNAYIFIQIGGTGGGAFRYMFSRFLNEAAEVTDCSPLLNLAQDFHHIGNRWAELADWFYKASESPAPEEHLDEAVQPLHEIAALEESAWIDLMTLTDNEKR